MMWIVIPAYNEGRNLPVAVPEIAKALAGRAWRLFIVNDGSRDNTLAVAQQLATQFPVTVLDHGVNKGVAEAFRTGLSAVAQQAQADDPIVVMEGDGTSDPHVLSQMADLIAAGADLVVASRYQPGGEYRKFPLKRLILSRGANVIFQLLFPVKGVRDYSIFYRAYRAGCIQQALAAKGQAFITVQTFFANIEMLLNLRPYLRRVEEIPLVYDYGRKQGKSGMKVWKNLRSYISFIFWHAFRSTN